MIDHIRANAEFVISLAQKHLGQKIGYDQSGVEWLDTYIQELHKDNYQTSGKLIDCLGSYLGECIVHTFGGQWSDVAGAWGVRVDNQNVAFPFSKVAKQLENGAEDSVLSFFTAIPRVFPDIKPLK
jgi:hypothetical protein